VLVVEDHDEFASLVGALLDEVGHVTVRASSLEEAELRVAQRQFDCALVDLDLPDATGLEAVMALRTASTTLPLVVLTARESNAAAVKAVLVGAQDWMAKDDVSADRLRHVIALAIARQDAQAELTWRASHDALTCLPNRPLALEYLGRAIARALRGHNGPVVMFCDLDGFKAVNDQFGHAAGDRLLSVVARRLVSVVRPEDVVARWSGDEFVIIADGIDDAWQATALAQRIRSAVAQPIALPNGSATVAITIGIAIGSTGMPAAALIDGADDSMLEAKRTREGVHCKAGF
jgi:diguanylate cyclase (GGDEF)-like protein